MVLEDAGDWGRAPPDNHLACLAWGTAPACGALFGAAARRTRRLLGLHVGSLLTVQLAFDLDICAALLLKVAAAPLPALPVVLSRSSQTKQK